MPLSRRGRQRFNTTDQRRERQSSPQRGRRGDSAFQPPPSPLPPEQERIRAQPIREPSRQGNGLVQGIGGGPVRGLGGGFVQGAGGDRREVTPTQRGGFPDYSGRETTPGGRTRVGRDHRATQPPQIGGFMGHMGAVGGGLFGDSDRLSLARRAITGQLGDRAARGAMGGMAGRGGELRRAATGAAGGALFDRDRLGLAQRALTGQREGEGSNAFRRALTGGLF